MPEEPLDASAPPVLRVDNFSAVRAHHQLRAFRRYEFAPDGIREPRRIALDDIERYARRFGPYDDTGFAFFLRQIGVMEDVFMQVAMENIATARRNKRPGGD